MMLERASERVFVVVDINNIHTNVRHYQVLPQVTVSDALSILLSASKLRSPKTARLHGLYHKEPSSTAFLRFVSPKV